MKKVEATFEGDYSLRFHLAPPLFSRPDPHTGRVRKREYGPWMMGVFRALARMKGLRGTALDVFGYTAERRLDRQLVREYEATVDLVLERLNTDNHAAAVELLSLPEHIRGYGHVKAEHLANLRVREKELIESLRTGVSRPAAA
jgi:indolepyruvate ferredoxin oxidoreductase